jgi:hypothetical protein
MSWEDFAAQQNSRRPTPKGGKGGKGRGGRDDRRAAGFLAEGAYDAAEDEATEADIMMDIPAVDFGFLAVAMAACTPAAQDETAPTTRCRDC